MTESTSQSLKLTRSRRETPFLLRLYYSSNDKISETFMSTLPQLRIRMAVVKKVMAVAWCDSIVAKDCA